MAINSILSSLNISASGLSVQRKRIDTIAKNLANVDTTRTEQGGPYRREVVVINERKPKSKFRSILSHVSSQLSRTHNRHLATPHVLKSRNDIKAGVEVDQIVNDNSEPRLKFDPDHPDADENGYVLMPNINVVTEMVDIISASRAYEANLTAIDAAKKIVKKSLEI